MTFCSWIMVKLKLNDVCCECGRGKESSSDKTTKRKVLVRTLRGICAHGWWILYVIYINEKKATLCSRWNDISVFGADTYQTFVWRYTSYQYVKLGNTISGGFITEYAICKYCNETLTSDCALGFSYSFVGRIYNAVWSINLAEIIRLGEAWINDLSWCGYANQLTVFRRNVAKVYGEVDTNHFITIVVHNFLFWICVNHYSGDFPPNT